MTTCEECIKLNIKNHKNKYENIIDKKTGKYIETLSLDFSNINLPKFLIFIIDMDYNKLESEEIQNKLFDIFKDKIKINSKFFTLKNIIHMPSYNHFTISIINVTDNLLIKTIENDLFYYFDDINGTII